MWRPASSSGQEVGRCAAVSHWPRLQRRPLAAPSIIYRPGHRDQSSGTIIALLRTAQTILCRYATPASSAWNYGLFGKPFHAPKASNSSIQRDPSLSPTRTERG